MEMTIYDILLEEFNTDDDQLYFEAKQSFSLEKLPKILFFQTLIKAVPERDKIIINLTNDTGRELRIDNVTLNDTFIDFISGSDQIDVTISINKNVLNHTLSIFNYNKFIDNLSKLDNIDFLNFLSSIITSKAEYILFEVYDNDMLGKAYRTETIFFKYYNDKCFEYSKTNRLELFSKVLFTNNFLNIIRRKKNMPEQKEILSFNEFKEKEYDKLAKLLRENLDIKEIYKILG